MARRGWVGIKLDRREVDWDHVADRHRGKLGACGAARACSKLADDERIPKQRRRRWINLGELIAIAALIVSALGVWIAWKSSNEDKPTRVVEQRQPIPLDAARQGGKTTARALTISPSSGSCARSR